MPAAGQSVTLKKKDLSGWRQPFLYTSNCASQIQRQIVGLWIIIIIISEFIIVKLRVETNQTLVFIR